MLNNVYFWALLWTGWVFLVQPGGPAWAVGMGSTTMSASNIQPVTFTRTGQDLNFGVIQSPNSGSQLFTVHPDGADPETTGSGFWVSLPQFGTILVDGEFQKPVNMSGAPGSCTGSGDLVTLTQIVVSPTSPLPPFAPVNFGGTLSVPSSAVGTYICNFTITGQYD